MATNPTSLNAPYIFLTGVVLIAVAFLFIVLQPMMDNANEIRHTIATDKEALKDKRDFVSSLDAKMQQLRALGDVEKQIAVVLPATDRTQDIVRVFHEYATQSGVTVTSVSNNSVTSSAQTNSERARGEVISIPNGVETLEFEVGVAGSYEQARLFLTLLGKSPRIMDVSKVLLKQVSDQPGQVTATITIELYSQKQAQGSGV